MPKTAGFTIDDTDRKSPTLTAAERAAIRRAEADIKAGRLTDHDDVARMLRQRAGDIAKRARKTARSG